MQNFDGEEGTLNVTVRKLNRAKYGDKLSKPDMIALVDVFFVASEFRLTVNRAYYRPLRGLDSCSMLIAPHQRRVCPGLPVLTIFCFPCAAAIHTRRCMSLLKIGS